MRSLWNNIKNRFNVLKLETFRMELTKQKDKDQSCTPASKHIVRTNT